ncbi:MAG: ketose-bisphosphate aldolase [Anaerotignaceae bacterium]
MLVNLKQILEGTREGKRAIGSFNVYSLETIQGVIKAVKKAQKPAIISFGASYLNNMSLNMVCAIVKELAEDAGVYLVLHLDHCQNIDIINEAIEAGFTSVMYDGSALDFEENVKNTTLVCNMSHAKNVSVEAELGSLALGEHSNETDIDHGESYTNPLKAREFVERTGVDALAVSIGTVHGMYKAKPNIRVDILKEIANEVNIPLVLHGGSGTPEEKILECIENGICKINVNTEISQYTVGSIAKLLQAEPNTHLSKLSLIATDYVSEVVYKYTTLFSNEG